MNASTQNLEIDGLTVPMLSGPPEQPMDFSVVTLVADQTRYERLVRSFVSRGFTSKRAQFVALDNRTANNFDGYSSLRQVLAILKGRYVLVTHDDIELLSDNADDLLAALQSLEDQDPNWMVAGNAGGQKGPQHDRTLVHLKDHRGDRRVQGLPSQVQTLDSNFLVMPFARMAMPSVDMSGFHFMGSDMCLQASVGGGSCYVIPFYLQHHAGTQSNTSIHARATRSKLEARWQSIKVPTRVASTTGTLYVGAFAPWAKSLDQAKLTIRKFIGALRRQVQNLLNSVAKPTKHKPHNSES